MENHENFSYTYCAKQQKEVEAIREKYLPKEESKMDRLRKLHAVPTQKARAVSLTVGILGTLVLGVGMSLCMTDLGGILGIQDDRAMVIGILVGLAGMVPVALAYPTYQKTLKKERQKIAPEILRLTDELMN